MAKDAKWTYMVYLAGDNNLSENGDKDLKEMRQVGSSPDVNVLVQFDNAGNNGTRRFHIQRGGVNEQVEELGETDSGDPQVLKDFIAWSHKNYPADRYALILWNHGGGWEPDDLDKLARHKGIRNWHSNEARSISMSNLKKTLFNTTISTILNLNSLPEKQICCDDGSGHSLDTIELGKVLSFAKENIGQQLDILGMDACLMSNLEVAYQAEPYVKYIVSSEETEPGQGWPYSDILDMLNKNPSITTPEFCSKIVEAYTNSYKGGREFEVTQSALDLSKVKDATKSLDLLAKALMDKMPDESRAVERAQNKSKSFNDYKLWDVSHFCKVLTGLTKDNNIKQTAQNVIKEFEPAAGKFIFAESHLVKDYDQCCGASIYLIPPPHHVSQYYADLEFAKDNKNWLLMLQKYHE